VPDSSRQRRRLLFKGQNVYGRNQNKSDVDSHRVDRIWNSVVGFIGYCEIFGGLTRGPEVVLDDDLEGAHCKAVMTNLNETATLKISKKNLGECKS